MNDALRDRLMRRLDSLPDERLYQILDYVEFLESRYAARQRPGTNPLHKFAEGVEDTLRAGRVSATAIAGTMNVVHKAVGVLGEVAAAGKSVASGVVGAVTRPGSGTGTTGGDAGAGGTGSTP